LAVGGRIAFYQADVKKLPDDFKDAQVTLLCGVPRVYERIYDRVQMRIGDSGCIRRWVANKAFREQAECIRAGTRNQGWDEKVFIPMRTMMGLQNVRAIVSGAAPMAAYLSEFLRIVVGAPVCQGYGMTESSAASCIVLPNDVNVGHVGGNLQCVEVCLEDVPEMNYSHKDKHPRGEILMRGPAVFLGYFKNEEATRAALTEDGWLHSGDVGRWNPNGSLSIIDRKKNMLKLSQGEYIALEKVEAAYKNSYSSQLVVYGNSYHSFLVAIVVPNVETIVPWLTEKGWWPSGMKISSSSSFLAEFKAQCIAHEKDLNALIFAAIIEQATANKLSSLEKIKGPLIFEFDIDGTFAGLTVENDCVTPTMKFKRNIISQRYSDKLQAVYSSNGEPAKAGEKW
jgi:long-chain acyl-CoA synthetase